MPNDFQSNIIQSMAEGQEPQEGEMDEKQGPFQMDIEDEEKGAAKYDQMAEQYPEYAKEFMEMAEDERRHSQMLQEWGDKMGGQEIPEEDNEGEEDEGSPNETKEY